MVMTRLGILVTVFSGACVCCALELPRECASATLRDMQHTNRSMVLEDLGDVHTPLNWLCSQPPVVHIRASCWSRTQELVFDVAYTNTDTSVCADYLYPPLHSAEDDNLVELFSFYFCIPGIVLYTVCVCGRRALGY